MRQVDEDLRLEEEEHDDEVVVVEEVEDGGVHFRLEEEEHDDEVVVVEEVELVYVVYPTFFVFWGSFDVSVEGGYELIQLPSQRLNFAKALLPQQRSPHLQMDCE